MSFNFNEDKFAVSLIKECGPSFALSISKKPLDFIIKLCKKYYDQGYSEGCHPIIDMKICAAIDEYNEKIKKVIQTLGDLEYEISPNRVDLADKIEEAIKILRSLK